MAFSTINKSSLFQNNVLYTGTGAEHAITGVGFQPDLVWAKRRNEAQYHGLYDAVRGATKQLTPNENDGESTVAETLKSFDSDGMTFGTNVRNNGDTTTNVAWNWLAGTTSGITTDGSTTITPSAYSFNQTSGFSICKYTGNYTSGAKVAHGLGATPKMVIVKRLSETDDWTVYHQSMDTTAPEDYGMFWNNNDAKTDNATYWNDTAPDSVNFTIGNNGRVNTNDATYIAYCFSEISGYSKFGSYIGNNNANGPFVFLGFKPSFIIAKMATGADDWRIMTENVNTRNTATNEVNKNLYVQTNAAESGTSIDFISNGMKIYSTSGGINSNNETFIYMAFGQPIISNGGVCATAR